MMWWRRADHHDNLSARSGLADLKAPHPARSAVVMPPLGCDWLTAKPARPFTGAIVSLPQRRSELRPNPQTANRPHWAAPTELTD